MKVVGLSLAVLLLASFGASQELPPGPPVTGITVAPPTEEPTGPVVGDTTTEAEVTTTEKPRKRSGKGFSPVGC